MSSVKTKTTKATNSARKTSKKKSNRELIIPDAWIDELAKLDINDSDWKCSVALMEEKSMDATVYVEHWNESALKGNRLAIKVISKLQVMQEVIRNLTTNNPTKELTPLGLLADEIYKSVGSDFAKDIPTALLAPFIKYLILKFKSINKKIREGIKENHIEFEKYQQSLWQSTNTKALSGKSVKTSKLEDKSIKTDKAKKGTSGGKVFTKLRKRGEEWKDVIWVDDSPLDGPQLYVTVSTFFDPDLSLELLRLNVPLDAIIKLELFTAPLSPTPLEIDLQQIFHSLNKFKRMSSPYLSSNVKKRVIDERLSIENQKAQISNFWKKVHFLKTKPPKAELFRDVMFFDFVPNHSNFEYQIKKFQDEIYKQVSHFLYDIFEVTKQHEKYLSEMKLTNVSDEEIGELKNMTVYNRILDSVPHEVLTIPFLLDALVSQVCCSDNGSLEEKPLATEETNILSNYSLYGPLSNLLESLNKKYDLFQEDTHLHNSIDLITSAYDEQKSLNIKKVLVYSDDINFKVFHLNQETAEFVKARTGYVLFTGWYNFLNNCFVYSDSDNNFIKLCNEIIKIKEENDQSKLFYYVYLLIINSVLNSLLVINPVKPLFRMTSLTENTVRYEKDDLCNDCQVEVGSFPSIDSCLFNKLSEHSYSMNSLTSYNISDEIIASNLFYVEDMSSEVLVQWVQTIFHTFNNLETRFCPFTDQAVLVFHNLLLPRQSVFEENWVGKLTSKVPLRDFVDYILDEDNTWLNQTDSQLDVQSSGNFHHSSMTSSKGLMFRFSAVFPDIIFISKRSLKFEKLLKEQKPQKSPSPSTKRQSKSDKTKPDSSKKSKGDGKKKEEKGTPKHKESTKIVSVEPVKHYTFSGYDLGKPIRFQFNGFKKDKILDDGCRLTITKITKLYGEEFYIINVSICGHSLFYNHHSSTVSTSNNPFHLVLSCGIILYFGSNNKAKSAEGVAPIFLPFNTTPEGISSTAHPILQTVPNISVKEHAAKESESCKVRFEEVDTEDSNYYDENSTFYSHVLHEPMYHKIPLKHSLKMSTPCGLHIELIDSDELLYLRQELLSKGPTTEKVKQERFRCYLSCGSIIKFMVGGEVEILDANGAVYFIYELNSIKELDENNAKENLEEAITSQENQTGDLNQSVKDKSGDPGKVLKNKTNIKSRKKSDQGNSSRKPSAQVEDTGMVQEEPSTEQFLSTETIHYKKVTSDGRQYLVQNQISVELQSILMLSSIDINSNCIKSERLDGVTTEHLADGSLVVNFPDGSHITSIPVENEDEFFTDWSPEELKQWFASPSKSQPLSDYFGSFEFSLRDISEEDKGNKLEDRLSRNGNRSFKMYKSESLKESNKLDSLNENGNQSLKSQSGEHNKTLNEIKSSEDLSENSSMSLKNRFKPSYSEDGFVVFNISYLMTHPNYCSVFYNANNCEIEFTLPFSTRVALRKDGSYNAVFDGAILTVDSNEIYFNRVDEKNSLIRTTVINASAESTRSSADEFAQMPNVNDELYKRSFQEGVSRFHHSLISRQDMMQPLLLYSVDKSGNELVVDMELNIHDQMKGKEVNKIKGSDFSCVVINHDLSGFKLVSDHEVNEHIKHVQEGNGLVSFQETSWTSLFTSSPVLKNESEKWLMEYEGDMLKKNKAKPVVSTYGKRGVWTQPFVEKDVGIEFSPSEANILRLLHRIPTNERILNALQMALENFRKPRKSSNPIQTSFDTNKNDFNLSNIVMNPKLLLDIYDKERTTKSKESDHFRTNMENILLRTLINEACIRARKMRQKKKEEELKEALRKKEIPPYHLSCFSQTHEILNEVLGNVENLRNSPSRTSTYERVNGIINEILSLACQSESAVDVRGSESEAVSVPSKFEGADIKYLLNEIVQNACEITKIRSYQNLVNAILEKPLNLVTTEEIDSLCTVVGSNSESCPIFENEDFILQDILNARLELSHYFENLREMLEFYRDRGFNKDINPTGISCC